MKGYKALHVRDGRYYSALMYDNEVFCLEYGTELDTVPKYGCCMVFASLRSARRFVGWGAAGTVIWCVDYDPAPIKVSRSVPKFSALTGQIVDFWLALQGGKYWTGSAGGVDTPVGTRFATRVRLVEEVPAPKL